MPRDVISRPSSPGAPTEGVLSGSFVARSSGAFDGLERIGAGGMGVVYRATDRRLGRSVALKFLSGLESAEARERFTREAQAASMLDHPAIGTIYSIEEGPGGELCIVMAYYEGETVADLIGRGTVPWEDAARIGAQVARGLAEAHAHGIIHRDIKPSNIILTRGGGVKIVDFGLARFTAAEHTITQPFSVMGTVAYMSPEQARGATVDARSDVWSLGAVLFEMLTGVRPFTGRDPLSQIYAVLNHTPAFDHIRHPGMRRIVERSLVRDPAGRYASAADLAADLEAESGGAPPPPSRPPRSRRTVLRSAGILALLALVSLGGWIALRKPWAGRRPVVITFLPFSNTQDPATAALATGLAESLSDRIRQLERFSGTLTVVPLAEVMGKNLRSPADALRQLGATAVVSGTLERDRSGALLLQMELRDARRAEPVRLQAGDIRRLEEQTATWLANALDIRANVAWQDGVTRNPVAYEAWLLGLGYLQRWDKPGNLDRAVMAFGESMRADSSFAPAYVGMAEASRTKFRTDADPANLQHALNYAQQAARLNGNAPEAHVVLGRTYHDTAQRDLAVIEFQRALELDAKNVSALGGMARAYEDLGRFAEAEATLQRVVAARPYAWSALNALGGFYTRRARYAEAGKAFRAGLALTPDNAAVWSNLGVSLLREKKYPEAITAFREAIRLGPSYAAYLNLGNIHYLQRDFRQAAASYERALQLNNRDFRVWGSYAQALRLTGAPAKDVLPAFESAIRLGEENRKNNPGQPRVLTLLAIYYACTNNRLLAIRSVEAGLASASADRNVLIDAAIAYQLIGQRANAVKWAQRALEAGVPWQELRDDPDLQDLIRDGAIRPHV